MGRDLQLDTQVGPGIRVVVLHRSGHELSQLRVGARLGVALVVARHEAEAHVTQAGADLAEELDGEWSEG